MTRNKTDTEKLIKTNQRYVELIAKQYQNRGLTMEQLIEEGNKGLIYAAERFVHNKGYAFMGVCQLGCANEHSSSTGRHPAGRPYPKEICTKKSKQKQSQLTQHLN